MKTRTSKKQLQNNKDSSRRSGKAKFGNSVLAGSATGNVATDKETQIINEAIKLFSQKGYHTTTLDEIAAALGITKAALYYYFPSKNHILRSIMQQSISFMGETVKTGKSNAPPIEKLREICILVTELAAVTQNQAKIFFEQIHILPTRTRNALMRKENEIIKTLQNVLQEGVDDKVFRIKDVKICSYAILGLCNWTYRWYRPGGRLTPKQIAEITADLILNGVLKC